MHRKHEPSSGWLPAFLAAWGDVGRPDFEAQHLLAEMSLEADERGWLEELWRASSSIPTRRVLALASQPPGLEQAEWLLQQLPALEDVALFIAALNVLSHETLPAEFLARARAALHRQLSRFSGRHPRSMQLRLLSYLQGTSEEEPLTRADLEALDDISALSLWRETSLADTFLSARQLLRETGLPSAGRHAFTLATLSIRDPGSYLLRKRAAATRRGLAPGARHPLGHIFSNVGARMAENSSLLERTLGLLMVQQGAEDAEDPVAMQKAAALLEELYSAQAAWRRAAAGQWPLHSLMEELVEARARDENALMRTFMAHPQVP